MQPLVCCSSRVPVPHPLEIAEPVSVVFSRTVIPALQEEQPHAFHRFRAPSPAYMFLGASVERGFWPFLWTVVGVTQISHDKSSPTFLSNHIATSLIPPKAGVCVLSSIWVGTWSYLSQWSIMEISYETLSLSKKESNLFPTSFSPSSLALGKPVPVL